MQKILKSLQKTSFLIKKNIVKLSRLEAFDHATYTESQNFEEPIFIYLLEMIISNQFSWESRCSFTNIR